MKTLFLMRHAKSSWDNVSLADHDRPLNPRGEKAAPLMAQWLNDQDCLPEYIVSSTANRAKSTANLLIENLHQEIEWVTDRRLYHASPLEMAEVIRDIDGSINRLMLVGHNPGMESTINQLTGDYERMPTAAIAVLELEIDNWFEVTHSTNATLLHIWRPKELPIA